jgi:predicted Zn finger-like uncharacterized protein
MNVSCPDCRSIFRVDPAKVPSSGVRARCSVCSAVISIPAPSGQTPPPSGGSRPESPASESGSRDQSRSTPPAQGSWDPPPFASAPQRAPAAPPSQGQQRTPAAPPVQRTPAAPPAPPRPVEAPTAPRPRPESIERSSLTATATPPSPSTGLPEFNSPSTPPSVRPQSPGAPVPSAPPFAPPSTASGPSAPPFVPSGPPSRPPATSGLPSRPPAAARPPAPALTPSPATSDGGARRPLNPFLSKDPNQRAKRLARALVSDIITYHPAKHAEGLRDGTLKQLFREEIKKSFEEYIAQVGQPLAESTTYFQEALNEVLAAGKKIF